MNSGKLLLSKLPYEPTSGNKSICGICKKPVSNLLLLAHSLIHKDETILSKSIESNLSAPLSPSITLQNLQPAQATPANEALSEPDQSGQATQSNLPTILSPPPSNPPNLPSPPSLPAANPSTSTSTSLPTLNTKRQEPKLSIIKCIKNSNACHTRFRRIEFTFKRCLKLQILKGFRKMKKARLGR